jgi:hypothetical protein
MTIRRIAHRIHNFFRFSAQRIRHGYSDADLWNFDVTIATWLLPRLRRFKDKSCSYPGALDSSEEWDAILDKMIIAFAYIVANDQDDEGGHIRPEVEQGLDLFRHFFLSLWD